MHHYFSFQIYTGRENGQEQGFAHRNVTDLLRPYRDTNIRVSMDNFYTGVPLLRELYNQGICAAGTIRPNRKHLPKDLLPKSSPLEKHNYRVAQAQELTFAVWMDTKAVCVMSNYHSPIRTGIRCVKNVFLSNSANLFLINFSCPFLSK